MTVKTDSTSEDKIEKIEDWRNEHGKPSLKYLEALARDGSLEAFNKINCSRFGC